MRPESVVELIERQDWLEQVSEPIQRSIRGAYAAGGPVGQKIKNFLHGTWLGHPLHSVLTDVPVGAWTVAAVLDLVDGATGNDQLAGGADLAVTLGAAGAAAAALAGLTDWEPLRNRRGRVGLVHASLNTAALLVYLASIAARRSGQRSLGRVLSYAGYGVMSASAFLGGELVYNLQTGVDHASEQPMPKKYVPALDEAELGDGQLRRVEVEGSPVLLVRQGSQVYAMADTCSHLGCSLAEGRLEDGSIVCSCHGSRYALADGHVLDGPSTYDQPSLETRLHKGKIEVRASRAA